MMEFNLKTKIAVDLDHMTLPKELQEKYDIMAPGFSQWFNNKGIKIVSSTLEMKARILGEMGVRKKVVSLEIETVIALASLLYRHFNKSASNPEMVKNGYAEGFMKGVVSEMADLDQCWQESKVKQQMAG